jgi:pimeloyl-ACP methyl ester carboxylesterase
VTEPTRARYPDEEGFVERHGVRVAWELYEGPGPTVLFVPQSALTHPRGLKLTLPYLARHFRILVVAGRGNGRSDRPPDVAAYSADELAADCMAAMDMTGTRRAMLVSFSPGAIVALKLCVDHPGRIVAGVFVTPDLWTSTGSAERFRAPAKEAYADDEIFSEQYMLSDWPTFAQRYAGRLLPNPHSTRHIENVVEHAMDTDGPTFVASVLGRSFSDRETALAMARKVTCPMIVMQNGGESMGPKETTNALAELPGVELHVFEGRGPLVWTRWPVLFNLVLRDYLDSFRGLADDARPASAARASRAGAGMPPVSAT